MNTTTTHKGRVVGVMVLGVTVEVWVSSPTGDSSDSHTFQIPCLDRDQAESIATLWRNTWGVK